MEEGKAMRTLGVVHARGGSKRIPGKNIKQLHGRPLLDYIIRAASESSIDRLIVSSDDDEIMGVARECGAEVPFRRPDDLAEDVPSELVTLHALDWLEANDGARYDVVVTLQPTTPFVQPMDIDQCISILRHDQEAASCFTAVRVTQHPQWMFVVDERGYASTMMEGRVAGERGVFQSLKPLFIPNGAAYATRVMALRKDQAIIANPSRLVAMTPERSIDIDEPIDWVVAEATAAYYGFFLSRT
ncbi:MAG: hypothetical protein NPIRA02_16320 [Nitrospirales bacterium]|nr:MAG: hypothetical protein NPIRA02_16320 [Nitrospirales bacterium]